MKLYELAPSPNNLKVVMALRYKGIDFETVAIDRNDRQPLIELTGQEATPIIADKGIVLNDSEAILQYLDANYPGTPRLYPATKLERRVCDHWSAEIKEHVFASWAEVFFHAIGVIPELPSGAIEAYANALAWLNAQVAGKDTINGRESAICDLRVALWASYPFPSNALIARVPLFARFAEVFNQQRDDYPELMRFIAPLQQYWA